MGETTVLIVDDEPDIIATLQFRLASAGYKVLTAEDGARALDVIRVNAVDLVLADFMMPEINGLELTRLVKAEPKWAKIKVLLFSCNAEPKFRQRALELGAVDYLSKNGGAQSIASRVYERVSPETETAKPLLAARESADETALQSQLLTLARHLDDVLKLAGVERYLPQSTQVALGAASRIAHDILLTAKTMMGDIEKAFAAKADDYVCKPFEWEELFGKINRCLDGRPETAAAR